MTEDEIAQAMQDSAGNSWGDEAHFQRFAALVIKPWADQLEVERKKFKELNDVAALGMQHARAAEREACAKVCESLAGQQWVTREAALECSDAIRARGNT